MYKTDIAAGKVMKRMKEKFYRIISPATLTVVAVLDVAIIAFAVFAIRKVIAFANFYSVIFCICEVLAIVLGVLVTKDTVTQGIIFRENELEFTHFDKDNIFAYDAILSIETQKDKAASLVKNFRDRQSKIIFNMTDGSSVCVDIGLTTDKTLKEAADEIISRIPAENIEKALAAAETAEKTATDKSLQEQTENETVSADNEPETQPDTEPDVQQDVPDDRQ